MLNGNNFFIFLNASVCDPLINKEWKMTVDVKPFRIYVCKICGWVYDEKLGCEDHGLPRGTRWEDVPIAWECPECGAKKDDFEMEEIN